MASNLSGTALRTIRALFTAGTVGGLTDGELAERFAVGGGDDDRAEFAFASLVERHGPMVLRVCRSVLRDVHEAEDAFQATFFILALKARSIRGRDSLSSWLYSVAYNVALTARSSAVRRRSHERKAAQARPLAFIPDAGDDLGSVIHEELDRIPERYRSVLVLCYLEGLTQHQAAAQLGWPLGTVQSRLARGRERLRARLARRGLDPSTASVTLPAVSESTRETLPAALTSSTVRLAVTIGAARALAIGVVPVAVVNLAKGAIRTMLVNKVLTIGMAVLLAAGMIATGAAVYAYQAATPDPAQARPAGAVKRERPAVANSENGLLTVTGVVRMRDGSPVAGATVRSFTGSDEPSTVARTDEAGRFQLQAVFGNGCRLHVSSADGSYQTVVKVRTVASRTLLEAPLELTLFPALHHDVTVLSDGRPVAGAQVAASGTDFQIQGVTGHDGKVRLRLPAKERLGELVAWHHTLGASGKRDQDNRPRDGATELSLLPPAPHRVRVVDVDGMGVGDLELGISVFTEDSDWIVAKNIEAAHVRTDADGTAIVPWAPRDKLKYVDVDFLGSDWKLDETDLKRTTAGITTVHVRRERTVQGRLIMPDGANAQGILVSGFGWGPTSRGDIPYARARRDGTFRLRVSSEHAYVLGIADLTWASDPWSGMILVKDSAEPAEITIEVYRATPLIVRVTRGPARESVGNAWVDLKNMGPVNRTEQGVKISGKVRGVSTWLTTDADGVARAGVGKGEHVLRLSSGDWNEERQIEVTSDKPVEIEFQRAWKGKRRITGRLMFDGAPYTPSPQLIAHAWEPQPLRRFPLAFEPVVHPNGTYEVAFDAESASLLFVDLDEQRSGFVEQVHGDADLEVTMVPTATYSGTLVDDNAQPVAGLTLMMYVEPSGPKPVAVQQTDQAGRFRFTGVPADVRLQFVNGQETGGPDRYVDNGDRTFKPGEVRENDRLKLHLRDPISPKVRSSVPLAKSVENVCRNANSSGMRALVALLSDHSGDTARTIDQLFDYDDQRMRAVLSYLTLRIDPSQLSSEAAILTQYGWPRPATGEVVLVALDGGQKMIASQRIKTNPVATAVGIGVDFLNQHRPPVRNAVTVLTEARIKAKSSGRRVWVVHGGPRCAPCFLLARWIEDHHGTVDKDYVVVKLMDAIDEHVTEAIAGLPINDGDGIPWFAITEPDGAVLAISRGPLGNIGFPSSVEGIRHFRRMLDSTVQKLTPGEVDRLINSLSSGK